MVLSSHSPPRSHMCHTSRVRGEPDRRCGAPEEAECRVHLGGWLLWGRRRPGRTFREGRANFREGRGANWGAPPAVSGKREAGTGRALQGRLPKGERRVRSIFGTKIQVRGPAVGTVAVAPPGLTDSSTGVGTRVLPARCQPSHARWRPGHLAGDDDPPRRAPGRPPLATGPVATGEPW